MRRDRLEAFIKFFETVPEEHFNLTQWASEGFNGEDPPCGSSACIGGWLAVSKEFQEAGGNPQSQDVFCSGGAPVFEEVDRERAFAKYFEIPERIATDITTSPSFYGKSSLGKVTKHQALKALKTLPELLELYEERDNVQRTIDSLVHEIGTVE